MNEELKQLAQEQIPKLPEKLFRVFQDPQTTKCVEEAAQFLNLPVDKADKLDLEITLLLLGLTNPQSFPGMVGAQLDLDDASREKLLGKLEQDLLNPIYGDLMRFYDEDQKLLKSQEASEVPAPTQVPPQPKVVIPKMPDVAPENLPTSTTPEEQPDFLPNLTPKIPEAGPELEIPPQTEPPHPFEEKMQKVFTGGAPVMDTLKIEEPQNSKPAFDITRIKHDPYREPIEI